ncbi:uncharacterized protein LOC142149608 [Mixophyes fleayi]|uniref:uncharacterized protein LOC142149608 n=1 Tax=Mixophyes fleayi TaxID=3061075 RepID=UPI003F4DA568
MASADLRQELNCSICLNIYTDPVTLRCGHNFCRVCIDRVLDTQEGSGVYTCPECRAECQERPALQRNITLYNIVGSFLSTRPDQEETGIFCTYCIHSPVPAAKSCLHCEASLCDNHVRVHSKSAEHVLSDPTTSLGNRKCSVHKELLKYYCTEDAACICVSCSLAGKHRGHRVEMLDEASEKKKEKLRNVLQKLTTKREKTEKRVQRLQERRREDQDKAAGVTETVNALFRDIRRQLDDLEKIVLSEVSRQEKRASLSVSHLIQQLEIKKDELSRKMHHIEELCNMSDPVTVLQEPDTGDLCDTEDRERHDDQVHGVGDLDVGLISGKLHTGLSDIITGINTRIYVQEPKDILLDVNTAANNIHISGDRKTASRSDISQNHPETPERFQYNQVISTRRFSSGRHYWEVNVSKSGDWRIGMCYPSIDRRGRQSYIGDNNKSWGLWRYNNQYSVIHDRNVIRLTDNIPCDTVRIYLDYEAGQLSFYSLCDPIRHLHTVTATFTEPLHAALWVLRGCIKISGGIRKWEKSEIEELDAVLKEKQELLTRLKTIVQITNLVSSESLPPNMAGESEEEVVAGCLYDSIRVLEGERSVMCQAEAEGVPGAGLSMKSVPVNEGVTAGAPGVLVGDRSEKAANTCVVPDLAAPGSLLSGTSSGGIADVTDVVIDKGIVNSTNNASNSISDIIDGNVDMVDVDNTIYGVEEKPTSTLYFNFHFSLLLSAMASADLRQELDCSICLNIYTDPVTLRCGHNFCRVCIDRVLDTQEGSGVYTCPECRAECQERPALQRNITLCNIVGSFLSTWPDQEETGIFCTYCIHSPVPAAKSCLLCEASLCDNHLRVHSKSAEHVLSDPTTSLGNRKCSAHKELLKYYCTEDAACICVSCTVAGEHQGHQVEMLDEASKKKKEKLRNVLQKLNTKREETEKRVQRLQERKREDQEKAAGVTETVTALFRDIRRQLEDLEKRVLSEISRQEESVSLSVSDLIQQMEIKKDELSRKMRHIEELCNMSDPVTVLQDPDTADLCDTEDRERDDDQVHGVGDLDVGLISGKLHTLSDIITGMNTGIYVQEATDILLDVNTAANNIHISGDRKFAYRSDLNQNYPETPERFQYYQVISSRRFSSGRHYWEVDVSKSGVWRVGMCYPSIDRRGRQSYFGCNNKSWCLCGGMLNNQYSVKHDNKVIRLPDNIPCDRVRIYLDYEAGQMSFYSLCDPIRHLHTFTATFTEPLHAALGVGGGCITISGGLRKWEK